MANQKQRTRGGIAVREGGDAVVRQWGGDRQIRCEGHHPPPSSGGKQKTRSPIGGDNDNDAAVLDNDGNNDAGPGRGFIACCDSAAYAGAKSACWWQDYRDRTRRRTAAMRLLDRMGGLRTTPSLLLCGIEDHDGGLSSSSSSLFNSL